VKTVVWDMTPCSLMEMYCRFGGTCCRHLQVRKERGTNSTVYQHWVRKMGLLRCGAVEFGRQLLVFQKKLRDSIYLQVEGDVRSVRR
jgi:hypothetical protein